VPVHLCTVVRAAWRWAVSDIPSPQKARVYVYAENWSRVEGNEEERFLAHAHTLQDVRGAARERAAYEPAAGGAERSTWKATCQTDPIEAYGRLTY
jgi:hypothetical protein